MLQSFKINVVESLKGKRVLVIALLFAELCDLSPVVNIILFSIAGEQLKKRNKNTTNQQTTGGNTPQWLKCN